MKKVNCNCNRRMIAILLSFSLMFSMFGINGKKVEVKAETTLSNPTTDSNGVSTWDCIYFGTYPQSEYIPKQAPENPVSDQEYTDSDGTKMVYREWEKIVYEWEDADGETVYYKGYFKVEPIKWRVLSVNGDDVFLIADQNLDCQPYTSTETVSVGLTWETSSLRTWLNSTFLSTAFTSFEQMLIKSTTIDNLGNTYYGITGGNSTVDKIYLLSIEEAANLNFGFASDFLEESETRKGKSTDYANSLGDSSSCWWLRSLGDINIVASYVCSHGEGSNSGSFVWHGDLAVRPALHLDLSDTTLWSYAGKVSANGGTPHAEVTSSPIPSPDGTVTASTPQPPTKDGTVTPDAESKEELSTPGKVTLQSVKNKKGKKLVARWKKVKSAKGYQLQYATDKKFKKKKSVYTKKTKYTLKKLKKKKTYYIRIRAYRYEGKKKVYGKWSSVKKVKVKK